MYVWISTGYVIWDESELNYILEHACPSILYSTVECFRVREDEIERGKGWHFVDYTYSEQWEQFACWLLVALHSKLCRNIFPCVDEWHVLFPVLVLQCLPLKKQIIFTWMHKHKQFISRCSLFSYNKIPAQS